MTRAQMPLLACFLAITAVPAVVAQEATPWHRRARLERQDHLTGTRILVVAAPDFNYSETVEMAECWKRWGAQVEIAAPERTVVAEREEAPGAPPSAARPTVRADFLLAEADPARYDVLYFAGGEGIAPFLAAHRPAIARLIEGVYGRGRIVSAICHGPLALAAAPAVIKGKRLTVQGTSQARVLEQAGAVLVTEIAVVDGQLVTGQWPHLEEFAVTLAERVQYPTGGGPREKALSARTPAQCAVDGLRDTHAFENRPVSPDVMAALARAAQKALVPRGGRGPRAIRYVTVQQATTKADLSARLYEKAKGWFVSMGMPEAVVRPQLSAVIEGAPVLIFQFVEVPAGLPADARDLVLRADTAVAGSAAGNLALVAQALGLGVSMIGMQPFLAAEAEIRQALQVPDNQLLAGIFGVGYPAVTATPSVARPEGDILFTERWTARTGQPR